MEITRRNFPPPISFTEGNTEFSNDPSSNHKDRSVNSLSEILLLFGIKKNAKSGKQVLQEAVDGLVDIVSTKVLAEEEEKCGQRKTTPRDPNCKGNRCSQCFLPTKGHICVIKVLRVWHKHKEDLIAKYGTFERFKNPTVNSTLSTVSDFRIPIQQLIQDETMA